jgi:hypothetical protein
MAKKLLLNRQREMPVPEKPTFGNVENNDQSGSVPYIDLVSEDEDTPITTIDLVSGTNTPISLSPQPSVSTVRDSVPASIRSTPVSEEAVELPFDIIDKTSKTFPKFNTTGRSLLIKFKSPTNEQDPASYFSECIGSLTNYLVGEIPGSDLVGLSIRDTENLQDKPVGLGIRRRDHLRADVVLDVLGKVVQSNARFGFVDRLEVHLDHISMPAGNGRVKTKGRSLDVLSAVKRSILVVKAIFLCLAHALIIAMVRVNGDLMYQSYRKGSSLDKPVKGIWSGLV